MVCALQREFYVPHRYQSIPTRATQTGDVSPTIQLYTHHGQPHGCYTMVLIPRPVMGLRPATGESGYLEPSQLITEEVLAILVTFEGAGEVQVHLRFHVLCNPIPPSLSHLLKVVHHSVTLVCML